MKNESDDQLKVSFPASPAFTRIGRVAIAGLVMRLGIDISSVEELRSLIDESVAALQGEGRISVYAHWKPSSLEIDLENDNAKISPTKKTALIDRQIPSLKEIKVEENRIAIILKESMQAKAV